MFVPKAQNPFARDAALCRLMSGHGVTLAVQGHGRPCTDGKVIYLPPCPFDADEIDRDIHDHSVAHEPAHVTEGSFDVDASKEGQFLHDIWNFLEDPRVEWSQERTKYPGLALWRADFLRDFGRYADRMGTNTMLKAPSGPGVVRGALCTMLLVVRGRQLEVTPDIQPSRPVLGFYRRHLEKHLDAAVDLASCQEALDLARVIHKELTAAVEGGALSDLDKLIAAAGGLGGEGDGDGESGSGAGKPSGKGDPDEPYEILDDLERNRTETPADRTLAIVNEGDAGGWKPHKLTNRRRFDKMTDGAAQGLIESGLSLLGPGGARMTRMFISNSRPRTLYNKREGRLDTRAVTGDHMDARRDLYKVRVRGSRDRAAASFLYDVSCSMDGTIDTVASIVAGIADHLDRGRIPFDIHAFGSYFHTFKEFGEPWRGGVAKQLAASHKHTDGSTATAWAFERVARGLMCRPESKKVLVCLTDGHPCNSQLEIPYVRRLSEALRSYGAVVIGIGLGVDLGSMFGADFINLPAEGKDAEGKDLGGYLCDRFEEILSRKIRVR